MKLPSMIFDSCPERSPWQAETRETLSPLVLRESLLPEQNTRRELARPPPLSEDSLRP
jgi:hypothetical protein